MSEDSSISEPIDLTLTLRPPIQNFRKPKENQNQISVRRSYHPYAKTSKFVKTDTTNFKHVMQMVSRCPQTATALAARANSEKPANSRRCSEPRCLPLFPITSPKNPGSRFWGWYCSFIEKSIHQFFSFYFAVESIIKVYFDERNSRFVETKFPTIMKLIIIH